MSIPKSIIAKRFFFVCLLSLFNNCIFGQAGKDGAKVISSSNSIVNDYTTLTNDASSGATSIQVANNSLQSGFSSPLSPGDLIFIIQVQGASIDIQDGDSYGTVLDFLNCGNNEFEEVSSVSGNNTINISCPLQYNYTAAGRVEIVRVPRYSSLTINGSSSITCTAWNGSVGGVIAIEVQGATTINSGGSIDANAKGFRGGNILDNNTAYGVLHWRFSVNDAGAEKGESIAGSVTDYDNMGGRYCKGAPANGGGGGNSHNCGGGGGANSGNTGNYNGNGNPDISNGSWIAAWDLEYAGFSSSTSGGGGKGGYSFSSSNQNALTAGPGNSSWGGDSRRDNGGRGGHPLSYNGKNFIGGGGGGGEQNNSMGGRGGNGGGLITIVSYGNISGSGQISSNGENGLNTLTTNGTDGAGGGGGGGSILLNCTGNISGITINANGGHGGSQNVLFFTSETEGPGGGGGGGYIALSNGGVSANAFGGANGVTNSGSLSEFPPNGATKGGAGINNATVSPFTILTQPVNICDSSSATLTFTTQGQPPAGVVYSWYYQATGGSPLATGFTYTTPVLTSSHTYYVSACPGFVRVPIQVNVNNSINAAFTYSATCAGSPVQFNASGSANINSWNWNFGDGSGTSTQQNPSYTYSGGGSFTVTLTVSNGSCTKIITNTITIGNALIANFSQSISSGCLPLSVSFTNSSIGIPSYTWNFGDGTPVSSQTNPTHIYSTAGTFTVTLIASQGGCTDTAISPNNIVVSNSPHASFVCTQSICIGDTISFSNSSTGNGSPITSYSWDFGDGTPASSQINPLHYYTAPGNYSVKLTTHTASCADDTTIMVNVSPGPIASFNVPNPSACGTVVANFNNTTTGSPVYSWNFGDGSAPSSLTSPSHTYSTPGSYTVTLIAIQGSCSDTVQQTNLIHVYSIPTSSFNAANVCAGDSVIFLNHSINNGNPILSYQWDFGDNTSSTAYSPTHLYSTSGTYLVQLTANSANCSDDTTISVTVNPAPVVSFSPSLTQGCDSATVVFNNSTTGANSYSWNFGDGGTSTNPSPTHTYNSPGTYTVLITATTTGGCSMTRVSLNMINIYETPVATITPSSTNICLNDCISFNAQTTGGANSWTWTFNGANPPSATVQNPGNICYSTISNNDVTLVVSNGFCQSNQTISSLIHVVDCSTMPKANFISSDTVFCSGTCIDFVDLSTNAISWHWLFPGANPSSSTNENPDNVCYSNQGNYDVTLIAGNTSGVDTIVYTNFIQVAAPPAIPLITQNGDTLYSTTANSYQWYFNGTPISGANLQQYTAMLSGEYSVETTDNNGCSAMSLSKTVSLVGIEELDRNLFFQFYPNPVSDEISIEIKSEKHSKLTFSIYDVLSSLVFYQPITMGSHQEIFKFNLNNLPSGSYFIQLQTDDRKWIFPLLKL